MLSGIILKLVTIYLILFCILLFVIKKKSVKAINPSDKEKYVQAFKKRFRRILTIGFIGCILSVVITYVIKKDIYFSLFLGSIAGITVFVFWIYYRKVCSKSDDYIMSEIFGFNDFARGMPQGSISNPVFLSYFTLKKGQNSKSLMVRLLTIVAVIYLLLNFISLFVRF